MENIITKKTQESIDRLLRLNNVTKMSYSILEFTSEIISHIKEDDTIMINITHNRNKYSQNSECKMEILYYVDEDLASTMNRETKIVVSVKVKNNGKKCERMLENISYLIASDYVNHNWKQVSTERIILPENMHNVRNHQVVNTTNPFCIKIISKVKDILYWYQNKKGKKDE